MERYLQPLYEFLPVTLEDSAVDAERQRFLVSDDSNVDGNGKESEGSADVKSAEVGQVLPQTVDTVDAQPEALKRQSHIQMKSMSATAANARKTLSRLQHRTAASVAHLQTHLPEAINKSRRREIADQLAASLAGFPDELTDLSRDEQEAELKAAFQDPVTREPTPVVWIPQDPAGISDDALKQASVYGSYLQYTNAGAYLTAKNKCEVTQPAPDVRPDWLLEWYL
jgi:hypothetical protein